ncbi:MAG TPA: GTP 3',8-cyclase MoaA [Desulfobacteraceae bacterium]|nr:GTP 3',8-cyclase MoaA [Desulfobacteraceae bacterium]
MSELIDPHCRKLNYLRISITDRCNLRCLYCAPPNLKIPKLSHRDILSYEEILRLVRIGVSLGISKVRITGGEPLIRKGVGNFLSELGRIREISDLSLTTNGVLLREHLESIRMAGIRRLNISLDTLSPEKFRYITGRDDFRPAWEGILSAHHQGFSPIKLNIVAMRGINDDEFADIARLCFSYPFHIRFIEYMPMGNSPLETARQILAPEIMNILSEIGELIPVEKKQHDGPAERYSFRDAMGEIGFIRPLSHHFCAQCNRLRLTASGQLRPCLLSDAQHDLKTALRNGSSDAEISDIFFTAARFKPHRHHLIEKENVKSQMSLIGG